MPRRYQKKKNSKSLAALSHKVAKLARETKPEVKEDISNMASTTVDDAGLFASFAGPVAGTADNQRIGSVIRGLSLDVRGRIVANGVSAATVRVIWVKDHQNNITLTSKILRYFGTSAAILSPLQDDYRRHFTLLSDRTYEVVPGTAKDSVTFHQKLKLNCPLVWDDAGVLQKNGIKMFAYSSHPAGSSSKPLIQMASTFYYTDV